MGIISRDLFAPRYRLTLNNGDIIGPEITDLINSVTYEDEDDMTDRMVINISTRKIVDTLVGIDKTLEISKMFGIGNKILLEGGYGNELTPIGKVEIIKNIPNFPRDGYPTMNIVGYDPFHKLSNHEPKKGVSYKEFRDSQIATIIASRHDIDYSKVKRAEGKYTRVQKKGVNDYRFLKDIAEERGFDLYLRYDKSINGHRMFFEDPVDRQKEVFTFNYGTDNTSNDTTLYNFSPEINTLEQPSDVEITIFNREQGEKRKTTINVNDKSSGASTKFLGTKKFKSANKLTSGGSMRATAFGESFEIISNRPFKNEEEARRFAVQWIRKRQEEFISGSATLVGLEKLQSRQTHIFSGLNTQLNGKYYFNRVVHKFTKDSYDCEVNVRKALEI